MTKPVKTSIQQLKDSEILYNKNPPAFALWLLLIFCIAMCIALFWSTQATKTYVIKSTGAVRSSDLNYIMSSYSGEIITALVGEGDYVREGDTLFQIESTDLDLQETQLQDLIAASEEKILLYEKLEKSVKTGVNLFDENNITEKPYYYQYEAYMSQVGQKETDLSAYQSYGYTDEQIDNAVRVNEAATAEIYYSTLKSISESIRTLQTEIENYQVQLASVQEGKTKYPIVASTSGVVHMDTEYKVGMVVQAGVAIGSIVAENEVYTARVYTSANDMPLIHVDDRVDIAVSGLTQTIYGTIGGRVSYIASEATINENDGSSSFLVEIDLDSVYLVSNQGNKVNLSNGMAVEARIQYDEVTYFNYMLEALGVLTR